MAHPRAGTPAATTDLVDLVALERAYYQNVPDPSVAEQRVAFGTSGHRGTALRNGFNEAHIIAIAVAVAEHRTAQGIDGPLFLGVDTHALSLPAAHTATEVLAAHGVEVWVSDGNEADGSIYTPTPVVSRTILRHNHGLPRPRFDGIVVTPSHNPPEDGGIKYDPPHGGPADAETTKWIERRANELLGKGVANIARMDIGKARAAGRVRGFDFRTPYVEELASAIDLKAIAEAKLRLGVDPLGGSNVAYWGPIAERYGLDLTVVNPRVDKAFSFMPLDHDGRIRMDCSSPFAMAGLVALKDRYSLAFGNDADSDRHGIVTPSEGLMNPNHFLAVAVEYLFTHRKGWPARAAVGKTVVTSSMLDRIAASLGRPLAEVPVGFKYFVVGLLDGSMGFGGEESAGASFLRTSGEVWTTDKDGILLDLLAAEIFAVTGQDPSAKYRALEARFGTPAYLRVDTPATSAQKAKLKKLTPSDVPATELAGEPVTAMLTRAPFNGDDIGGIKVVTANGWFAARPSGTEDVYKIYAESFLGTEHLGKIVAQATELVNAAMR